MQEISRTLLSCKSKLYTYEITPHLHIPSSPNNQLSISVSVYLPTFDTSHKWNYTVYVFISLSMMSLNFIHVVACDRIFFLFKDSYSIVHIQDHILFTQSSTSGHEGCFHCWTAMNNAKIANTSSRSFFRLLSICLEAELLGHMVILC